MSTGDFTRWFHHITWHSAPHDWQTHLAMSERCRNRMVRVGTGLGKTEGVRAPRRWHHLQRRRDIRASGTLNAGCTSPRKRWIGGRHQ